MNFLKHRTHSKQTVLELLLVALATAEPSLWAPFLSVDAKRWLVSVDHVGVATDQGAFGQIAAQHGDSTRGNDALKWKCKRWMYAHTLLDAGFKIGQVADLVPFGKWSGEIRLVEFLL